ncbi:hypothetical protein N7522_006163 [Penicillium canescens]|nr:hypothetical protein N7522_006163 [Penicillium canescens]
MAQDMEKEKSNDPMKTKLPYRLDDKIFFRNASGGDPLPPQMEAKLLKKYIQHCPTCRDNAVLRHKLYGSLQPILTLPTPFRTTTLEFVVGLPTTVKGHNAMLNLTDQFT